MTDVRELVLQLAVAKAVADQVKLVQDAVKRQLEEAMDPGDRKSAAINGADVGTVSFAKTSAEAVVVDAAAFTEWAAETAPDKVSHPLTVDAADVTAAADWLNAGASSQAWNDLLDLARKRLKYPAVVDPYWQRDVLAQCMKAKAAVYVPTGEEIPGVVYRPGGEGKYVSARMSDEQLERLQTAYVNGELDLFQLATIAPKEIES